MDFINAFSHLDWSQVLHLTGQHITLVGIEDVAHQLAVGTKPLDREVARANVLGYHLVITFCFQVLIEVLVERLQVAGITGKQRRGAGGSLVPVPPAKSGRADREWGERRSARHTDA